MEWFVFNWFRGNKETSDMHVFLHRALLIVEMLRSNTNTTQTTTRYDHTKHTQTLLPSQWSESRVGFKTFGLNQVHVYFCMSLRNGPFLQKHSCFFSLTKTCLNGWSLVFCTCFNDIILQEVTSFWRETSVSIINGSDGFWDDLWRLLLVCVL